MPAPISVLALATSPRVGGNTDRLMDAFLEGFSEEATVVNKIYPDKLDLHPCAHCGGCLTTGVCVQKDDMGVIYRELSNAGVLVLASPVYFMGVTAQAKTVIDRCQSLWVAKYRLGRPIYPEYRPGVFISAAGQASEKMFECPLRVVGSFFRTVQFKLASTVLEAGLDEEGGSEISPRVLAGSKRKGRLLRSELNSEG